MKLTQAGDKSGEAGAEEAPPTSASRPTRPPTNSSMRTRKHRATYTGNAHMSGPSGDVTADKIELFLAEQGGELERAEADGNVVSRQDLRRAYGKHLTYQAKDEPTR